MNVSAHFLRLTVILLLAQVIWSCAVNPVTGKRELMLISEQEEIAMGQQYDPVVISQYGLYKDAEIEAFVTDLGTRMAATSHRPHLQYHFRVLDSPVINAFAVPGGYIYFTRGILAYLNSEAEFAGVMGHEIGHVTARHTAQQQSRAQLAQLGLGIGSILSSDVAAFAGIAGQGLGLLFLKFGRDDERQSDELGVAYSTEVGYDAHKMAGFFDVLDRMSPEGGALPTFLSTHPNPADRVVRVHELADAAQQGKNRSNLKVGRDEYLKLIDGIVYGNDPNHGYVEGSMFYHPQLKFQLEFPSEWQLVNTPSQVQIVNSTQDAVILLSLESGASPQAVAEAFLSESGAVRVSGESIRINGLPAYRLVSDLATQQGNQLRILTITILYDQNIYLFHGFTTQASFQGYESTFMGSITSFRSLSDPAKLNVQPDRIRIRTVQREASLQAALGGFGISGDELEKTALLNNMQLTDQVTSGTLIKTIGK